MNRSNPNLHRLPLASIILALVAGPAAAADETALSTLAVPSTYAASALPLVGEGVPVPSTSTVRFYTNCDDDGMGSMRQAINASVSGDSVRASATLSCSTITLQSPLTFGQADLDIEGLGADRTIITAAPDVNGGLINHLGGGQLNLQFLTLTGGHKYNSSGQARGGCVYGANDVAINSSRITHCIAKGVGQQAVGGGVFSAGLTTLRLSEVSGNVAMSDDGSRYTSGGGMYATGGVGMDRSVVAANATATNNNSWGGGFTTPGAVTIVNSAIINNQSRNSGGAHIRPPAGSANTITNTTISGNSAMRVGGLTCLGLTTIASSTITANKSTEGSSGGRIIGGGLDLGSGNHVITSTIITGNLTGTADVASSLNLSGSSGANLSTSGSHDHISGSTLALPSGTITTAMQMLPLALNGAARPTHALRTTDPDVDAGSAPTGQTYDQRGNPFLRTVGSQADIGAFELDPDIIYRDGFDASIATHQDSSLE